MLPKRAPSVSDLSGRISTGTGESLLSERVSKKLASTAGCAVLANGRGAATRGPTLAFTSAGITRASCARLLMSGSGSESAGMRLRQRGWICLEAELMPTAAF
jgi:hypothetical protein